MKFARKFGLAVAAGALLGLMGLTGGPAVAADSSWGCGGFCKTAPTRP